MTPDDKKKFEFEVNSGMRKKDTGELLPEFGKDWACAKQVEDTPIAEPDVASPNKAEPVGPADDESSAEPVADTSKKRERKSKPV